jgi:hypothetical protein
MKTGNLLWTYGNGGPGNSTNSGFEVPGPYPTFVNAIGNDVVYLVTSEHTIQLPIYRGALMRAVNATTGKEIFTLSNINNEFATSSFAIADGFVATFNGYDNQIYSVGRGPSATTVSAPDVSVAFGTPVVIKGSVIDKSAGTRQSEQEARFPNGVPVSSDASMGDWMGYVYQQQVMPANFKGVDVIFTVLDANGNYRQIGSTTTDTNGKFNYVWKPDIPGKYTVYASFAGTNGYWPSYSNDAFDVMEQIPATAQPSPIPQSIADQYFVPAVAGVIAAIIIVGVLVVLVPRKRQ